MITNKGQAALEFLTTYGWALLAVLSIIGIIAYSGITNVSDKIPESCTFSAETSCGAFYGLEDGRFAFEITNMQRTAINITNVSCSYTKNSPDYIINLKETTVEAGKSAVIFCNAANANNALPKVFSGNHKFQAKIYYHFDEIEALPKVMTGEIVVRVLDDETVLQQYINAANRILEN